MPRQKSYEVNEVLEKAMFTFWKHGYEATSVRVLEKEMGINQFSIYASFKNKQGLFVEVLKMYKQYIQKHFLERLVSKDSKLADIECFLKDFARAIQTGKVPNGCLMVNTSAEISPKDVEFYRVVKSYFKTMKHIFRSVLINAQKRGEIKPDSDVDQYANYLLGIAQGITVVAKMQETQQMEDYVQMAMKNII